MDGRAVGVVLQTAWPRAPRWLSAPCYIALGWVAVFVMPDLLHNAGVAAFVLIAAGGVVYTIGGDRLRASSGRTRARASSASTRCSTLCTLVAALCHYIAIWLAVFAS